MAEFTGQVSHFHNLDITGEQVATGDGGTTNFGNVSIAKPPAFPSPATLTYTVGASQFQATADSAGVFSGTHLTSGTLVEDEIQNLQFSTAPDGPSTPITLDYRTKGLLQKVKELVAVEPHVDNAIETGDGIQTSFSGSLTTSGTLARGQTRITFTIGTLTYRVWDNGQGEFIHDLISSSSLVYATKAYTLDFTSPIDDTTDIDAISTDATEGLDWLILQDETTKNNNLTTPAESFPGELLQQVTLKNSGKGFEDAIFIGYRECKAVAQQYYSIDLVGHRDYVEGQPWNNSAQGASGHGRTSYDTTRQSWSSLPRLSLNDDVMTYWVYSNKNRLAISVKVTGTVYESHYGGNFLRNSARQDYAQPLIILGSHVSTNNFASQDANHKFIIDPSGNLLLYLNYNGDWRGDSSPNFSVMLPRGEQSLPATAWTQTTNGLNLPFAVYLYDDTELYNYGQLDGIWFVPGDNLTTEDTTTILARTITVFQNVFRTAYQDFMGFEDT